MAAKKSGGGGSVNKSAKTGKFVTKQQIKKSPSTTFTETTKRKGR